MEEKNISVMKQKKRKWRISSKKVQKIRKYQIPSCRERLRRDSGERANQKEEKEAAYPVWYSGGRTLSCGGDIRIFSYHRSYRRHEERNV